MKFIQNQNYAQCYARSPFCCGKPMPQQVGMLGGAQYVIVQLSLVES